LFEELDLKIDELSKDQTAFPPGKLTPHCPSMTGIGC
jgi:hypothetical protein